VTVRRLEGAGPRENAGPVFEVRGPGTLPAWLWLATALFIVYGATIPFNFSLDASLVSARLARTPLNPLLAPSGTRRLSIPDAVQNMLLFAPFGLFGVLTLRRWLGNTAAVVTTAVLGFVLAVGVEALQLLTTDRTTATADVLTNTLGSIGGGVAVVGLIAAIPIAFDELEARGLVDVPAFYPMLIAVLVLAVAACEPFDFTLDVSGVAGKVRAFLRDPVQFRVVNDEGAGLVRYALLALAAGLWLRQLRLRQPMRTVVVAGIGLAAILEGVQIVIESRMPGLEDLAVHAAGIVLGAWLADRWPLGLGRSAWLGALAAATALAAAMMALSPFSVSAAFRLPADVPFLGYYQRTTFETLSHVIELMLVYLPLGFCIVAARPSQAPASAGASVAAVLVTLAIAAPIEIAQGWISGRFPDITDIGVSSVGALVGAWLAGPGQLAFVKWRHARAHRVEIL
jgi:VanZ family protein